jgi:hypothetical protein
MLSADNSHDQSKGYKRIEFPPASGAANNNEAGVPSNPEQEHHIARKRYIQSSSDFVSGFTPPDYVVDGMLQRGSQVQPGTVRRRSSYRSAPTLP